MLKKHCRTAFATIRIRKKALKPSPSDKLINKRDALYKGAFENDMKQVHILNVKIANMFAIEKRSKCHMLKQYVTIMV